MTLSRFFRFPKRRLLDDIEEQLGFLRRYITAITGAIKQMSTQLDALKAQLAQNTTVIGSAVALIGGLKQQLDDAIASGDVAQLQALSDQLAADDLALAHAVSANTPGGPVVEPAPPTGEPTEGGDATGDEPSAPADDATA
jgi:hypothetical protein